MHVKQKYNASGTKSVAVREQRLLWLIWAQNNLLVKLQVGHLRQHKEIPAQQSEASTHQHKAKGRQAHTSARLCQQLEQVVRVAVIVVDQQGPDHDGWEA